MVRPTAGDGGILAPQASGLRSAIDAFSPPKAKEFESA